MARSLRTDGFAAASLAMLMPLAMVPPDAPPFSDRTRIFKRDALEFASHLEPEAYTLAFADPPYESRMLDRLIEVWRERRFATILSVEHAATQRDPGIGLEVLTRRAEPLAEQTGVERRGLGLWRVHQVGPAVRQPLS